MSWHPLLEGDLAERARALIHQIAASSTHMESGSGGPAGLALFYGYLARFEEDERFAVKAQEHLDKVYERAGLSLQAGFFEGFPGLAWSYQHLTGLLEGDIPVDLVADVDELLLQVIQAESPVGAWQHDLISGLAGLGCYALDHPDRSFAARLLETIVDRLEAQAKPMDPGITWWTAPVFFPPESANRYPEGFHYLPLAHGAAGVAGMLSRACGAGLATAKARRLLDGAVAWILANKRPNDGGSIFPVGPGKARAFSVRSAWCKGDPGIAAVLLLSARCLHQEAWEREALAAARHDCGRPDDAKEVVDATLCHGAAGLGHLYNRFYQATGMGMFADAAIGWFERALGEYLPDVLDRTKAAREGEAPSDLLEGASGIGLALIASVSSLPPDWDQPLLLGIPS